VRAAAAAALLVLAAAAPASAYHREEHYYTVRLALADLRPRIDGDETAAMCAQLADEARELNAIEVYRALMRHPVDYAAWSLGGGGSERVAGRMATIQTMLHGLTGGTSAGLRAVAVRTVSASRKRLSEPLAPQQRADALCALGFALHLYGDSYAHARIKNRERMYDTGIGHFFDASVPDFPLCAPHRRDAWESYLLAAPALFVEHKRYSDLPALVEASRGLTPSATRKNRFEQPRLKEAEIQALAALGETPKLIEPSRAQRSCRDVVEGWARAHGVGTPPTCAGAWSLFYEDASAAFADYESAPEHAASPARAKRSRPFSPLSPFPEETEAGR
jgi:hypothetical protein